MGSGDKSKCKLVVMFTLNFGYFLVELIVGYFTNSMALVADSFHMLSDVVALIVAYFAVKMSPKKWSKNTYGWARAEVLGALVNAVFLIALCFSIMVDSIQRFFEPVDLKDPELILIVGSIGLVMNVVGLCIFRDHGHGHGHSHDVGIPLERRKSGLTHSNRLTRMVSNVEADSVSGDDGSVSISTECTDDYPNRSEGDGKKTTFVRISLEDSKDGEKAKEDNKLNNNNILFKSKESIRHVGGAEQMNIKGVFLHLLADTMGSVVVVASALIVKYTKWEYNKYIDPSLSICMVILICISVYPLFVESSLILLQSVPGHIDMNELESKLLKHVDGVIGIHELHVWQLAGDRIIATAHIKCRTLQEYFYIAEKVKAVFHNEGIHSTTIQPEFSQQSPDLINNEMMDCYLSCSALSTKTDCSGSTCCPPAATAGQSGADQSNHNQRTNQ